MLAVLGNGDFPPEDDGSISLCSHLPDTGRRILGLHPAKCIPTPPDGNCKDLTRHRTYLFRGGT